MTADLERLGRIAGRHRRVIRPWHNHRLALQLAGDVAVFRTTTGPCDCGTALGSAHREARRRSPSAIAQRIRSLCRRGWSTAKIDRWREQQGSIAARSERVRHHLESQRTPDADQWASFIRAAIESGATEWFGLLLHWYRGFTESEPVALTGRCSAPISGLDARFLLHTEEDVLYEFRR